jgi:hypothetical protein
MGKDKSPIDNLFFELYGYFPNKAGQAYEILVAAALKLATDKDHKYDQHLRGEYSKTDYQIDGLNVDELKIVEAKDYTIDDRKVGRPDLQKLQGALSDLQVNSGVFASATDYTKPAKKYSLSSTGNPLQKEIELFEIRPSTELDEEGRIKKFIINMTMVVPNYSEGVFNYAWTEAAINKFTDKNLLGKEITMILDRFYKSDGSMDCLLMDYTKENQPLIADIKDKYANGCWLLHNRFIKYEEDLFGINGIEYKIPYNHSTTTFTIESEGEPKILIKSDDGKINKLLTDKQFKELTFDKGTIN